MIEKKIENVFTLKLSEIYNSFPQLFMKKLMNGKGKPDEIKKDIVGLIFDTIYYIICESLQELDLNIDNFN